MPIRPTLPRCILYLSLFGSNPVAMFRSLDFISTIKTEMLQTILNSMNELQEESNEVAHDIVSGQLEDMSDINEVTKDVALCLGTDIYLNRGESIFRREWAVDEDFIKQGLSMTSHPALFSYVVKYILENDVEHKQLENPESIEFSRFYKYLREHLPKITNFIDMIRTKADRRGTDTSQKPHEINSIDGSIATSGIGSMTSGATVKKPWTRHRKT